MAVHCTAHHNRVAKVMSEILPNRQLSPDRRAVFPEIPHGLRGGPASVRRAARASRRPCRGLGPDHPRYASPPLRCSRAPACLRSSVPVGVVRAACFSPAALVAADVQGRSVLIAGVGRSNLPLFISAPVGFRSLISKRRASLQPPAHARSATKKTAFTNVNLPFFRWLASARRKSACLSKPFQPERNR